MTESLDFNPNVSDWHPTGSNYICDPPVENTDIDTIVLANEDFETELRSSGWSDNNTENLEYESMGQFTSYRKGNLNYIVTNNPLFYHRFVKATRIAKEQNLINKTDRVALFQEVLYGP